MMKKKVTVIGMGYIGLPTATLLVKSKLFQIVGVDISRSKLNNLRKSKITIFEKPLNNLINKNIKSNNIYLTTEINQSDYFIVCVPTPFNIKKNRKTADLSSVYDVIDKIINVLKSGDTIIIESTVPVGTGEEIYKKIIAAGFKAGDINLAYCPERVLPGNILKELVYNDRVVGGINNKSKKIVAKFYKKFVKSQISLCDIATAEMCKLVENSYRDTNIAFANEISMICDKEKIDTSELIKLANKHPRVNILRPGCGVGGHCIAVDPYFLIDRNYKISKLLKASRDVNDYKMRWVKNKIKNEIKIFEMKNKKKPTIGYLGLTYKADSADLRQSPSLEIAKILNKKYKIYFVDPFIKVFKNFKMVGLNYALKKCQLIFILINHSYFRQKKLFKIRKKIIKFDFST